MKRFLVAIFLVAGITYAFAADSIYRETNGTINFSERSRIVRVEVSEAGVNSKLTIYDNGEKKYETSTTRVDTIEIDYKYANNGTIVLTGDTEASVSIVYEH